MSPSNVSPLNVYAIVAPAVLVLVLIEFLYCLWKRNGYYSYQDSLIGMGTAILAQCVNLMVTVGVIEIYGWIETRYGIFEIEPTLLNYVLLYLGVDFLFYWFHRAGHRVNLLWAAHVPHHSAEELNYAVALRASLTQRAASFLFYWPLALLGFPTAMILPVVALNLILQFIPHTRVIPKLPSWIDSWLNTPYHHQVHHAANEIYWDKNYGGTFIFWDKWFGSYADQTEEVYYGVSVHPKSWDATYLNLHWLMYIWRDAVQAEHWIDKIKVWFMPPGWRPRGLPAHPKPAWRDARNQIKYQTEALPGSGVYLIMRMIFAMAVMLLVISDRSPLSGAEKIGMSFLLWIEVTLWGAILESRAWAKGAELVKNAVLGGALFFLFEKYSFPPVYAPSVIAFTALFLIWSGVGLGRPALQKVTAESVRR